MTGGPVSAQVPANDFAESLAVLLELREKYVPHRIRTCVLLI